MSAQASSSSPPPLPRTESEGSTAKLSDEEKNYGSITVTPNESETELHAKYVP